MQRRLKLRVGNNRNHYLDHVFHPPLAVCIVGAQCRVGIVGSNDVVAAWREFVREWREASCVWRENLSAWWRARLRGMTGT